MQLPVPEIVEQILADNVSRHPEKRTILVGGERIPVIVCNPSPTILSEMVAAALTREDAFGLDARVVCDCVLYPAAEDVAKLVARWPALPRKIAAGVEAKIGVDAKLADLAAPPPALADLPRSERLSYHAVTMPGGDVLEIAIERPTAAAWDIFRRALKQAGSAPWPVLRDWIAGSVKSQDMAAVLERYPGVALPLFAMIGQLVGAGAELEAGEW